MSVRTRSLLEFEHSYARELPELSVSWTAASVPAPALVMLNEELATELGVDAEALRDRWDVLGPRFSLRHRRDDVHVCALAALSCDAMRARGVIGPISAPQPA
jgi:uncharacterized protein YdiU (UPF0061 family)